MELVSTVTDIDGNEYATVLIGTQLWMAENLRTTHYADGSDIPLVEDRFEWTGLSTADTAYSWYGNNHDKSIDTVVGGVFRIHSPYKSKKWSKT